jgi:ferredoxin
MQYDIPDERLPKNVLDVEIGIIRDMGAEFRLGTPVTREIFRQTLLQNYDAVILATGSMKPETVEIFGIQPDEHGAYVHKTKLTTSIPGVFACGNIIREQKMAVHSAAQGKMAAIRVEEYFDARHTGGITPMHHKSVSVFGHLFKSEWKEYLQESNPDPRNEPVAGKLAGFTPHEAMLEAKRCMHCDCRKPVSCKLRRFADKYEAHRRHFAGTERKPLTRLMQHELVVYEPEKCIRCGLCIEITEKHGESVGLTFAGRGFDVRIKVPFNQTTRVALTRAASQCVESCPTGALAFKGKEERIS